MRDDPVGEFRKEICKNCRICLRFKDPEFRPNFCLNKYLGNRWLFRSRVLPKLYAATNNIGKNGVQERDVREIFCSTGICFYGEGVYTDRCSLLHDCVKTFQRQANEVPTKKGALQKAVKGENGEKVMTKEEFIRTVCEKCGICESPIDPYFCFDIFYTTFPDEFLSKVVPAFADLCRRLKAEGRTVDSITHAEFKKFICRLLVCYKTAKSCERCCDTSECYDNFVDQICGVKRDPEVEIVVTNSAATSVGMERGKEAASAEDAVFFSSKNPDFLENIKKIIYGNKDSQ